MGSEAATSRNARNFKLELLEVGRALAALAVCAHHAELSANAFTTSSSYDFASWGMYGVDFFFVLSGFIIFFAHQGDARTTHAAKAFFLKRIKRVYVPYLPISLFLVVAYTVLPSLSEGSREWGMLTSLTLLPTNLPPALSVAWTLIFEMLFYTAFILFYITRHFFSLMAIWAIAVIATYILHLDLNTFSPFLRTLLNPIVLEFLAGVLACYAFLKFDRISVLLPLLTGLATCILFFLWIDALHRVFLGFGLALVVLAMCEWERRQHITVPSLLLLLGGASYAIYLVHNPAQSIIARFFRYFDSWYLSFFACLVLSISLGLVYHLLFEKPLLKALRSKQDTTSSAAKKAFDA